MNDPLVIQATANILFHGFPDDAQRIAALLARDSLMGGRADRARMWDDVATQVGAMFAENLAGGPPEIRGDGGFGAPNPSASFSFRTPVSVVTA